MIVDTHVHPISNDRTRYPLSPGGGPEWYVDLTNTAEECIAQMDAAGVDQMVLVSSYSAYGHNNSYAADAAASRPDRFVGFCRIDPLHPESLDTWVVERGMRGVRLGTSDERAFPTCERARELGIPVSLQVPGGSMDEVRKVAERFPDVKVILDHLAHPALEDGPPYAEAKPLFELAACPNVYLKFSSMNIWEASEGNSTPRAFFEALIARFGPERLLWGTDFPHTLGSPAAPYKDLVDLARETFAFVSAEDREQIFAGTARSLFPTLAARV